MRDVQVAGELHNESQGRRNYLSKDLEFILIKTKIEISRRQKTKKRKEGRGQTIT